MKRVVADTNVLVSALQFGGKPKQLLDLATDGQIDLTVSEAIIAETLRARYSSDNQRDASIADQLRVCRAYAERQGWTICEE